LILRELLRLRDSTENNRLLDVADGAWLKVEAQLAEKELRMVLDDCQPGMVVGRLNVIGTNVLVSTIIRFLDWKRNRVNPLMITIEM
jgi:hypothetical protein